MTDPGKDGMVFEGSMMENYVLKPGHGWVQSVTYRIQEPSTTWTGTLLRIQPSDFLGNQQIDPGPQWTPFVRQGSLLVCVKSCEPPEAPKG